ncbi:hypothetical protein [Ketobacter alkanivorans]|jgi:hypothetical protein|uniref:Copper resistance protein CopB n=1 Tax=Ketobacter alkanivorans TaxID=1917421 RepID=A0A2K9LHX4_9GAMM|nr:hypothetical protein [Ketobacter alkanivorans]MAR91833.1 hypothetical protein [Pseudomonadales bacterium]HAU14392.1 hypothetical protein [Gammaproteobacteria bacterium]AUM11105.1 hypothetical protein Kalk_01050 [Ketobacter alkanivorans]MAR93425.1 hypothetical protein [Pseudomonadales bacterium]HBO94067.1 hypothetical protein [Gammaproteobacteria bacterium]|tara:strand:- start:100 stop:378 length:279 start_codon:yes stop_codon:yes gene_type:complete
MKVKYMLLVAGLSLPLLAQAHDPKEHMKDAEKPDCAAMNNMDHSKMDRNDPVMQAMMKKCMADTHHQEDTDVKANHRGHKKASGEQHLDHGH